MRPLRRYLARSGLAAASLLLALLLGEVLVRTFSPYSRDHVVPPGLLRADPTLGWELVPGIRTTHRTRYFKVVYRVNDLGFRDGPRSVRESEGRRRLLLYGDSEVFGWGVPESARFSNEIEKLRGDLELWNLAVPGYGLDQQVLAYERRGGSWNADEAVFYVSIFTVERSRYGYVYRKPKPRFVETAGPGLRLIPASPAGTLGFDVVYRLVGWMYLPHFVEKRLGRTPSVTTAAAGSTPGPLADEDMAELTKRMLIRARARALQRGHAVTVISNLPSSSTSDLRTFCRREGIGFLEIPPAVEAEFSLGPEDRHWNAGGHRRIARELACRLGPTQCGDRPRRDPSLTSRAPVSHCTAASTICEGTVWPPSNSR